MGLQCLCDCIKEVKSRTIVWQPCKCTRRNLRSGKTSGWKTTDWRPFSTVFQIINVWSPWLSCQYKQYNGQSHNSLFYVEEILKTRSWSAVFFLLVTGVTRWKTCLTLCHVAALSVPRDMLSEAKNINTGKYWRHTSPFTKKTIEISRPSNERIDTYRYKLYCAHLLIRAQGSEVQLANWLLSLITGR